MTGPRSQRGLEGRFDGVLCGLALVVATLAALPFAEAGFIDDWSYFRSAEVMARTGHLAYNGWATAMVGWQISLGALVIRLFGDSLTAVRMSSVAIAFLTVWTFHSLLRRAGLSRSGAAFGALSLGLSPLFLPLAASFMTDTNAIFPVVLCGWLCLRALRARTDRALWGWLVLAAVTNAGGGTVRQTVWLAGVTMVPAAAWLLRRRRHTLSIGLVLGGLVAVTAGLCVVWWNHEPFAVQDRAIDLTAWRQAGWLDGGVQAGLLSVNTVLALAYLVFPALSAWLWHAVGRSRAWLAGMAGLVAVLIAFPRQLFWMQAPWLWGVMWSVGPFSRGFLPGWTDAVLARGKAGVSALVLAAVVAFAVWALRRDGRRATAAAAGPQRQPRGEDRGTLLVLFGPYCLGYSALLLTRVVNLLVYDRYLLGLAPFVLLALLRLHQDRAGRLPVLCSWVLAGMALFTVMGTHDWFARLRATQNVVQGIVASGVRPEQVSATPERDGMLQLDRAGYIDEPRMRLPLGAYRPNPHADLVPANCRNWMTARAPVMEPRYVVREGAFPCLPRQPVTLHPYATWLPPFHRDLYVMELPNPPRASP